MPLKIKRIVSTNFHDAKDNPLRSATPVTPPFLVREGGILHPVDAGNFAGDWDVMVLNDGVNLGLPGKFDSLNNVAEVLWLYHRGAALGQLKEINDYFGNNVLSISFQHTPDDYNRYLYKVEALWKPGGEYGAKLAELDRALRMEQVESDIVDVLWLLALYGKVGDKFPDVEDWATTDNRISNFTVLVNGVTKAVNDEEKRAAYTNLKNALRQGLAVTLPA